MEADKSPDLQLASWSSRRAAGMVPMQRPTDLRSKKVTVALEVQRQEKKKKRIFQLEASQEGGVLSYLESISLSFYSGFHVI